MQSNSYNSAMPPPHRYSANELMAIGLTIFNYHRWEKYKLEANIDRFMSQFGVTPNAAALVWDTLVDSTDPAIQIQRGRCTKPKFLLLALRWLFVYETERQIGPIFAIHSRNTVEKHLKIWVRKIQLCLPALVRIAWRKQKFDFAAPLPLKPHRVAF